MKSAITFCSACGVIYAPLNVAVKLEGREHYQCCSIPCAERVSNIIKATANIAKNSMFTLKMRVDYDTLAFTNIAHLIEYSPASAESKLREIADRCQLALSDAMPLGFWGFEAHVKGGGT